MTALVVMSPSPVLQFFDNAGRPAVGGTILTQVGGVNYPTYQDSAGNTALPNPIPLNSRGEVSNAAGATCQLFLVSGVTYTFTLKDANSNQLWQAQYVGAGQLVVANYAAAAALSTSTYGGTMLLIASKDGGLFRYDSADTTSTADGSGYCGTIIVDASNRRWKRDYSGPADGAWWGVTLNGSTNDATFTNNALNAVDSVVLGAGTLRASSTVLVPANTELLGVGLVLPSSAGVNHGTVIKGDNAVTPVVDVGVPQVNIVNANSALRGLTVARTGSAPANSIGVRMNGGQGSQLSNVFSYGHFDAYYCDGNNGGGSGTAIAFFLDHIFSGNVTGNHLVMDTMPEIRVEQSRFGVNGTGDQNCNAYVKIIGGIGAAPAAGPNTLVFNNCQFNQGGNKPDYWIEMADFASPIPDVSILPACNNCHIEGVGVAMFKTDSTVTNVQRAGIDNCEFNEPTIPFFALDPATVLNAFRFSNNFLACSTFAPDIDNVNSLAFIGNVIDACDVSFDSGAIGNWNVNSAGNIYNDGATCTIAGSRFGSSLFADTYQTGCTFTNNITGNYGNVTVINPANSVKTWTPTLKFGGAAVGMTYDATLTSGAFQVIGSAVHYQWRIKLSAKGASTGSATILGFPVVQNTGYFQTGAGGVAFGNNNMAGLTSTIIAQGPVGTPPGEIDLFQQGAATTVALNDTNFTNTSDIAGSVTFFL